VILSLPGKDASWDQCYDFEIFFAEIGNFNTQQFESHVVRLLRPKWVSQACSFSHHSLKAPAYFYGLLLHAVFDFRLLPTPQTQMEVAPMY
jgi:hypothetical protein